MRQDDCYMKKMVETNWSQNYWRELFLKETLKDLLHAHSHDSLFQEKFHSTQIPPCIQRTAKFDTAPPLVAELTNVENLFLRQRIFSFGFFPWCSFWENKNTGMSVKT